MTDTTPEAAAVQRAAIARLTGVDRLRIAFDMSEMARTLAVAGLRADHPDWTERQIVRELVRLAFLPSSPPPDFR